MIKLTVAICNFANAPKNVLMQAGRVPKNITHTFTYIIVWNSLPRYVIKERSFYVSLLWMMKYWLIMRQQNKYDVEISIISTCPVGHSTQKAWLAALRSHHFAQEIQAPHCQSNCNWLPHYGLEVMDDPTHSLCRHNVMKCLSIA